jgi:TnpA family transposase
LTAVNVKHVTVITKNIKKKSILLVLARSSKRPKHEKTIIPIGRIIRKLFVMELKWAMNIIQETGIVPK